MADSNRFTVHCLLCNFTNDPTLNTFKLPTTPIPTLWEF